MKRHCPFCKETLCKEKKTHEITEYFCFPSMTDHHYSERLAGDRIQKLKIRLTDIVTNETMYLRVDFEQNFSHVWTTADDLKPIQINSAFMPDFSHLGRLKAKIKTYLIFS